eukprot:552269-Rhodomonas_salina.2
MEAPKSIEIEDLATALVVGCCLIQGWLILNQSAPALPSPLTSPSPRQPVPAYLQPHDETRHHLRLRVVQQHVDVLGRKKGEGKRKEGEKVEEGKECLPTADYTPTAALGDFGPVTVMDSEEEGR